MSGTSTLSDVDLNLLVVLDTLVRTRSVSLAARELGLTQSGASRALARLREQIADPLFVTTRSGLQPTPVCDAIVSDVERALAASSRIYNRERFIPAQAKGTLRLGLPDHLAYLHGPALLSAVRSAAPAVDLELSSFSADWRADLEHDRCDLAFAVVRGARGALKVRRVLDDPWVVIFRHGHPALEGPWSAKRFAEGEHAIMSVPGSGPSPIDRALARRKLKRSVVYRASSPLVVAMAAVESDLRVTTTRALATKLAQHLPLEVRRLPLPTPSLDIPLVWHERRHEDPRHRFFRQLVAETVRHPRAA